MKTSDLEWSWQLVVIQEDLMYPDFQDPWFPDDWMDLPNPGSKITIKPDCHDSSDNNINESMNIRHPHSAFHSSILLLPIKLILVLFLSFSEPGICYDESDLCVEHAKEGKCTNSALHEYANFCKRSCGLCSKYLISFYLHVTFWDFLSFFGKYISSGKHHIWMTLGWWNQNSISFED